MAFDRLMPGMIPNHVRFDLENTPDGGWTLLVWSGDIVGLITRAEMDRYENLTWLEAFDVIGAILDAFGGS